MRISDWSSDVCSSDLIPRGIWYTAVSGIWQTVWLEPVADLHIADLRAVPDIDKGELTVDVALSNTATPSDAVRITARDKEIGRAHVCTPVTNAHLVCRLMLETNKNNALHNSANSITTH